MSTMTIEELAVFPGVHCVTVAEFPRDGPVESRVGDPVHYGVVALWDGSAGEPPVVTTVTTPESICGRSVFSGVYWLTDAKLSPCEAMHRCTLTDTVVCSEFLRRKWSETASPNDVRCGKTEFTPFHFPTYSRTWYVQPKLTPGRQALCLFEHRLSVRALDDSTSYTVTACVPVVSTTYS